MTRLARQNGLTLEQFRIAVEQSGQNYAATRESLRRDLAIQRSSKATLCGTSTSPSRRSIILRPKKEGMTQPEYQVIQALLATKRGEDCRKREAKETQLTRTLANIQGGTAETAVSDAQPIPLPEAIWDGESSGTFPACLLRLCPVMSIGDVEKFALPQAFILFILLTRVGGERFVKQTDVRHILIKPTEVIDDAAAEALAGQLMERVLLARIWRVGPAILDDIGSAA